MVQYLGNTLVISIHCFYMAYTINPQAPKVRRDAVVFANKHGVRTAGRRYGVSPGTISKWRKKAEVVGLHPIPTRSSRPKHSPRALGKNLVKKIIDKRLLLNRSAEVVQKALSEDGVVVSLMSVKRTLDRGGYLKKRIQIRHRHTRVRQSNDNAHIERFNRTLREECIDALPINLTLINRALPKYLKHYVETRHHFGINLMKPIQLLTPSVSNVLIR